jgi:hypothetical protein
MQMSRAGLESNKIKPNCTETEQNISNFNNKIETDWLAIETGPQQSEQEINTGPKPIELKINTRPK